MVTPSLLTTVAPVVTEPVEPKLMSLLSLTVNRPLSPVWLDTTPILKSVRSASFAALPFTLTWLFNLTLETLPKSPPYFMPSSRVATVAPPTVIRSMGVPVTSLTGSATLIVTVVPGVPSAPAGPVKPIEPSAPLSATPEPSLPLTATLPSSPSVPAVPMERSLLKPTVSFLPSASAMVVILPSPAIWMVLPRSCLTAVPLSSVKPKPPIASLPVPSIIASLTDFSWSSVAARPLTMSGLVISQVVFSKPVT